MLFQNYGLQKTWLGKCLESPVLGDPSIGNIVNEPKDCWNMKARTFTIFNDYCESSLKR